MSLLSLENLYKNSFEDDTDPELMIVADEGEDETVALSDAAEDLAAAERIDDTVGASFEALILFKKIEKKTKKRYGIEDDASVVEESTETPAEEVGENECDDTEVDMKLIDGSDEVVSFEDAATFFKQVGSHIALGFKKMIAGLMNFIKSIVIWIGGAAVEGQDKLYLDSMNNITTLYSANGTKELRLPPRATMTFENLFKNVVNDVLGVNSVVATISPKVSFLEKLLSKAMGVKDERIAAVRDLKDLVIEADKNWKEKTKSLSAKDYVAQKIYGNSEGAVEIKLRKIKEVFSVGDFKSLTKEDAQKTKELMNAARTQIKVIEGAYKSLLGGATDWAAAGVQTDITLVMNRVRAYLTHTSSMILSAYLEYLRYRANLAKALRALGAGKIIPEVIKMKHSIGK